MSSGLLLKFSDVNILNLYQSDHGLVTTPLDLLQVANVHSTCIYEGGVRLQKGLNTF